MGEKYLKTKEGSIEDTVKNLQNKVLESDYQDKFKKELENAGKPIGHMTGAEKKEFYSKVEEATKLSERGGANTSSKQGSFARSRKPKYRFGYRVAQKEPEKGKELEETHTTQTARANAQQRSVGGEKSPISHMVNKSIKEITKDDGKTFAQMRAEIEESKDSEQTYPSKETKIKGSNPADKGEKEHQTGEDTRDPKKKAMSGGIATTPEMNPKVDYKY